MIHVNNFITDIYKYVRVMCFIFQVISFCIGGRTKLFLFMQSTIHSIPSLMPSLKYDKERIHFADSCLALLQYLSRSSTCQVKETVPRGKKHQFVQCVCFGYFFSYIHILVTWDVFRTKKQKREEKSISRFNLLTNFICRKLEHFCININEIKKDKMNE